MIRNIKIDFDIKGDNIAVIKLDPRIDLDVFAKITEINMDYWKQKID